MKKRGRILGFVKIRTPIGIFDFQFGSPRDAWLAYTELLKMPTAQASVQENVAMLDAPSEFIESAYVYFLENKSLGFEKMFYPIGLFDSVDFEAFKQRLVAGFIPYCERHFSKDGFTTEKMNFLCPFHAENNPSARFYDDKNLLFCGHDHFGYDFLGTVQKFENVGFWHAVNICAVYAGVENPYKVLYFLEKHKK